MKSSFISVGAIAFFAFTSCAGAEPEVDQLAQQKMIGLSKKKILACMGSPARRLRVGSTEILIYPSGNAVVEGGLFSPGVNGEVETCGRWHY